MYKVIFTDHFINWLESLSDDEQDSVLFVIGALKQHGYHLNRPYADTIKDSDLTNLKELRIQHQGKPYRAFFVFDSLRQAVILCGGNKTGDKRFYQKMIPLAKRIYSDYLKELEQ